MKDLFQVEVLGDRLTHFGDGGELRRLDVHTLLEPHPFDSGRRLGGDVVESWLREAEPLSLRDGVLTLGAPNGTARDWIDKKYGAAWRESIDPTHASSSESLHRPEIFSQLEQYAQVHSLPSIQTESDQTTHYSVVDADGNAVAVTTTLNAWFGSGVTAEGLGFLLNDEMDDFAAKQGVPNMFGLIQGPANAIGPGKRPLSAMAPTIVLKDDKLFLVLGSPGGPRIITTVANILMGVVDYGMNIQEAVNAPRFHHQWLPDVTSVEQDFPAETIKLLENMGHKVEVGIEESGPDLRPAAPVGQRGDRLGASDKRNNGKAIGF